MGGRSSKSYRDAGFWSKAPATRADHALIQFGRNDQPGKGPERETDPDTEYVANLARYVTEARAAGMRPALVTSFTRRDFDERSGRLRDTLGTWVTAAKCVAAEQNAPLIDLRAASTRLCAALGQAECALLSPHKPDGTVDTTHPNATGGGALRRAGRGPGARSRTRTPALAGAGVTIALADNCVRPARGHVGLCTACASSGPQQTQAA